MSFKIALIFQCRIQKIKLIGPLRDMRVSDVSVYVIVLILLLNFYRRMENNAKLRYHNYSPYFLNTLHPNFILYTCYCITLLYIYFFIISALLRCSDCKILFYSRYILIGLRALKYRTCNFGNEIYCATRRRYKIFY